MTHIPKVKFEFPTVEQEARLLFDFSRPKVMFIKTMESVYPELIQELRGATEKSEEMSICRRFAEEKIIEQKEALLRAKKEIEEEWTKIEHDYLKILSEHLETDWPADKTFITGYISILPICPRYLKNFSFSLDFKKNVADARVTIAHEILHFIWFKKWLEVFADISPKEYECPHLVWRLSEVMDPIILHSYPEICKLIKPKSWGYNSFKNLKIGDKSMTEYFNQIYSDGLTTKLSFDQILKKLWKETQKHQDILNQF